MLTRRQTILLNEAKIEDVYFSETLLDEYSYSWPLVLRTALTEIFINLRGEAEGLCVVPVAVDNNLPVDIRERRGYPAATWHSRAAAEMGVAIATNPSELQALRTICDALAHPATTRMFWQEGLERANHLMHAACRRLMLAVGVSEETLPWYHPLDPSPPPVRTERVYLVSPPPHKEYHPSWREFLQAQAKRVGDAVCQVVSTQPHLGGRDTVTVVMDRSLTIYVVVGNRLMLADPNWCVLAIIDAAEVAEPTSAFWSWKPDPVGDWLYELSESLRRRLYCHAPNGSPPRPHPMLSFPTRGSIRCDSRRRILKKVRSDAWLSDQEVEIETWALERPGVVFRHHFTVSGLKDAHLQRGQRFESAAGGQIEMTEMMTQAAQADLQRKLERRSCGPEKTRDVDSTPQTKSSG